MKLIIFSLTTFDVVIFTDIPGRLPVDRHTDPHNRGAALTHTRGVAQWVPSLTAFDISRALFACTADHQSACWWSSHVSGYTPKHWRRCGATSASIALLASTASAGRDRCTWKRAWFQEGSDMSAAAVASKLNKTQSCSALTRGDSWGRNTKVDQCACHAPASSTCQNPSVRTAPPRSAHAGAHPLRNGASGRASQ